MQVQERFWYSERLYQDMYFRIYGHGGKPCLVIPSQNGNHTDYEGFGMVEACRPWIDTGKLQLYCVDTVDADTVSCGWKYGRDRLERHEGWIQYLIQEVWPLMANEHPGEKGLVTGCSMGAYHAGNLYFRFPDRFDSLIALSGTYNGQNVFDGYMDGLVYLNSPVHSLQNMPADHPYMELYRQGKIFICVGQGAWEDMLLAGTRELDEIIRAKGIPAFIDYWGYDVNHDWPWWRKQMAYFLDQLLGNP